jgi:hypothetical protein
MTIVNKRCHFQVKVKNTLDNIMGEMGKLCRLSPKNHLREKSARVQGLSQPR